MKEIIFGKDTTENIVNVSYANGKINIYTADGSRTNCRTVDHQQFALTSSYYEGSTQLKGRGYYKYRSPIYDTPYHKVRGRGIYTPRSQEEGYMMLSGMTYYKGMKVNEVSLLGMDIEATTLIPSYDHAKVLLISNTYRSRSGQIVKKLFDINDYVNQQEMLEGWSSWVREVDPDILLAHNGIGYDFPYMAKQHDLHIGRDGSAMRFDEHTSKKRKDGQQSYDFHNVHVDGREVIDTMFMAITFDIGRQFPSYGLKRIEEHLKLVDDDRIEWDFKEYPTSEYEFWPDHIWELFRQYAKDDADSLIKMFDIMAPSLFYLNQSIPKKFQQMINEATGSQIDSFMIRGYLQDNYSLPMTSPSVDFEGAISMGIPGVYDNVRKVDVASLYPSIMREYKIAPKKDYKGYFLKSLDYFTEERLKNKKLAKETQDPYYDGLQAAQKIVINSMYGFMGANYLLFNDPAGAAEVTRRGRDILQIGVQWATGYNLKKDVSKIVNEGKENEKKEYKWFLGDKVSDGKGYTLVNVDTDSFSYTNNAAPTSEEFASEIRELNDLYPSLIRWEDDNVFRKLIVIKAKNYIMDLHPEWGGPKVKYKGSSIKDQKKEPILRNMMNEIFEVLLEN